MGIKTSDVLEILLSVSGLQLDELYAELQGLCTPRGWTLASLEPGQLREVMFEYLNRHMALVSTQNRDPENWSAIQPGLEPIEA
jgi:hypothetical protein